MSVTVTTEKLGMTLQLERFRVGTRVPFAYVDEDGTATVTLCERTAEGWKDMTAYSGVHSSAHMAVGHDDFVIVSLGRRS